MGGSGGGFFSKGAKPDELARRTRAAEGQARDERFETAVNDLLSTELAEYNDRDTAGIQEVLDSVKRDLEKEIEGTVDTLFGGSIAKHTYVDGLSDVDALVLLDRNELVDKKPDAVKAFLVNCLQDRYGKEAVYEGTIAVTLNLREKSVQLLPALRHGDGFKIAGTDGKSWTEIRPRNFAKALANANKAMDGKLVPCIKLAKAIIHKLPEKRRLIGYHTESLAIKLFRQYSGPRTPKAMLRHFFEHAPQYVMHPIKDSTGQSVHVDDYLGGGNSLDRRIVADALSRIGRKIRNADGARSLDRWKELTE